jgi:outer membrane protein assembly factor BamA
VTNAETLAPSLNLTNTSAAYVYDTSAFGATSPISGQRYRLEASPTFGALSFTNLLVDYRRYLMPAPFYTIAARVVHDGRYGSGGEDQRLFPMYIGYPSLVRGYDINTFGPSDCVPSVVSQCPAFDRLLGSRMLVGNLEFRFPLLRPFGATSRMYGPVPIEVALFADGGVAWNSGQKPAPLRRLARRRLVGRCGAARESVRLRGWTVGLRATVSAARKRLGRSVQSFARILTITLPQRLRDTETEISSGSLWPVAVFCFGLWTLGFGLWDLLIDSQIRPELTPVGQV